MTQHQKIIEMCGDGQWHCQNEFRDLYIFSPHKRRSEIEKKGVYVFIPRKCEHGVKGQFDYIMAKKDSYTSSFPSIPTPDTTPIIIQPQLFNTPRSFE